MPSHIYHKTLDRRTQLTEAPVFYKYKLPWPLTPGLYQVASIYTGPGF